MSWAPLGKMSIELFKAAGRELLAHPLRTGLTTFGFATSMAIATVLLATGAGLETTVGVMLRNLGEGNMTAEPGTTTGVGGTRRSGREVRIRFEDIEGIRDALPSFSGVAAYFNLRGGGASSWRYSIPWSPVRAVSDEYFEVRGIPLSEGRWFTEDEVQDGRWVTVLNVGLRNMIFPGTTAVGRWVEWQGRRMTVVGVVRDEAEFPYILFVPYKTVSQNMADARYISALVARPEDGADWDQGEQELRRALAGLGGFDPLDENALEIESNRDFTRQVRSVSVAFRVIVLTIASVSLLLGGLGVANMMVISVTERTPEIGLWRALGATADVIVTRVLFESALLTSAGGILGLVAGGVATLLLGSIPISGTYSIQVGLDPFGLAACFLGLGVAAFVAAFVPVRKATALAPAEALRWE